MWISNSTSTFDTFKRKKNNQQTANRERKTVHGAAMTATLLPLELSSAALDIRKSFVGRFHQQLFAFSASSAANASYSNHPPPRVRAPPVAKLQPRVCEALALIFSFSTWLLPLISTFFVFSRDFFLCVSNTADKVWEVKGHNKNDDGAICPVLVGCCCVCFIDALNSRVWIMLVNICVTVVTVIDRWSLGNVSSRQWNCAHVCASVNYCMCTCLAYLSLQWFTCLRYAATLYWLLIHWW